ncbi:hypothetical protein RB653_009230 [Dictyostelium firmibasis]|uniref:Large ribosomal subunit protein uL30m n=1 Tax=Dictyostelium firmibasis TaxID=79012 RepID=A0AAN7YUW7_9MYCE
MAAPTKAISSIMQTQLKRQVFRGIPHNILTQFQESTIQSFPLNFISSLPAAPSGVIKITLTKSGNRGVPTHMKGTINALGLKKIHHYMYHKNTPEIRGMIHKLRQYVKVEEIPINN